jgi:cytochrome c oxidase cbb3-type subunit 3
MYVKKWITGVICLLVLAAIQVIAQNPRPITTGYPTRPPGDPAVVERGRLVRIDDFIVTIMGPDDAQRTFRRDGASPKVEMHDPMQSHRDLLRAYTDKDIHNVTAYLESLR